jgi:hypothetical protein
MNINLKCPMVNLPLQFKVSSAFVMEFTSQILSDASFTHFIVQKAE